MSKINIHDILKYMKWFAFFLIIIFKLKNYFTHVMFFVALEFPFTCPKEISENLTSLIVITRHKSKSGIFRGAHLNLYQSKTP